MNARRLLLGITGGIAAYKSAELCRLFVKSGAEVQVVMTRAACEFITPLTLQTLSGRPVHVEMFGRNQMVPHIEIAGGAELLVVAPATADFLARAATGRASDLLSAVTLAFVGPVLAAPAMNTNMWENPATKRNLRLLSEEHGWRFVQPGEGELACGTSGAGRMAEPQEIWQAATAMMRRDLDGRAILVTAGPTVEDIDPVRFLSNRSTGKMGYAIATAAAQRGAKTVLVSGPTHLPCPADVELVLVRSALEMQAAVWQHSSNLDAIVMCAAVADFRAASVSPQKLKKQDGEEEQVIRLARNPDILGELGQRFSGKNKPLLVGFAVETEDLLENAQKKLAAKKADFIVANLAMHGFGGNDDEALIIDKKGGVFETGRVSKRVLADAILDRLLGAAFERNG